MSESLLIVSAWAFATGLFSALATGLGVIPVSLIEENATQAKAWASGLAAGMMVWASLATIITEGMALSPYSCLAGAALGAAFLIGMSRVVPPDEEHRGGLLLWFVMLIHSFPEGLAIGVGFATGDLGFGILLALVISVHNIPEGVAISLAMRSDGASLTKCFWYSVASSLPQPLVAVPAAIFVSWAQVLIPPGLGFAGGAMLLVAGREMIPQALDRLGRARCMASLLLGAALMGLSTYALDQFNF